MSAITYDGAPVDVRDDLVEAHRLAWQTLAEPGNWWTGAERVAMADEVRAAWSCELCTERKSAVSPYAVEGTHDRRGDALSDAAVDAVHRIARDPGRLSKRLYDDFLASGLSDAHYVELVGVVVRVVSIDIFCRAVGAPLHPLPDPVSRDPNRYRPASARDDGAWVPMIPNGAATGSEADLYADVPRVPNVGRALSLVPNERRTQTRLVKVQYAPLHLIATHADLGRAISRSQIELVAGRVSAFNECFY